MTTPESAEPVIVGHINGLWGVQGWVRIFSDTRPPIAIFDYQPWYVGDESQPVEVAHWRKQGPRLVACLKGISTPEQAQKIINAQIRVPRSALPAPSRGQYYWSDLVGLDVYNLEDHCYGKVTGLMETGANDVLEIRSDTNPVVLIPFIAEKVVKSVDLQAGQIRVDWPLAWLDE